MPVNIIDVDEFTDPVRAPDDGDPGNGATFQISPQDLANRTRNLKNRVDTLYGGTVALTAPLLINDQNVTIEENLTVSKDLTVGDDLSVTDDVSIGGNLTVSSSSTFSSTLTVTGALIASRIRFSVGTGPDADTTLTPGTHSNILIATTVSANRIYTPGTGSAGDWFLVRHHNNVGFTIEIIGLTAAPSSITLSYRDFALIVHNGTSWTCVAAGEVPNA